MQQNETFAMRREIPDWILREGGRADKLVLDRLPEGILVTDEQGRILLVNERLRQLVIDEECLRDHALGERS